MRKIILSLKGKKFYLVYILLLLKSSLVSQTVNLTMMSVSNQPIPDCETIDLESNSFVSASGLVTIQRQTYQSFPSGYLYIYAQKSTTDPSIAVQSIFIPAWGGGPSSPTTKNIVVNFTLQESQFNSSGGQVYASYKPTGANYRSCEYPVIKDYAPVFQLTPSSVSIPCQSTTPVTFTVNQQGGSGGGTITYQWSFGTGWSHNGVPKSSETTAQNNITLVPLSYPPSNVTVVPIWNGINQPSRTSQITLQNNLASYSISANTEICGTSIFSVPNLPSGISVLSWSIDNNAFSISPNGNQATVSPNYSGAHGFVNVYATIADNCNQQSTLSINRYIGKAEVESVTFTNGAGGQDFFCTNYSGNDYEFFPKLWNTTHQIRLSRLTPSVQVIYTSGWNNGDSGTMNYTPSQPGYYLFEMRRTNSCGTTDWWGTEVEFVNCMVMQTSFSYSIYPNPASDELVIEQKGISQKLRYESFEERTKELVKYEIYNSDLTKVLEGEFETEIFRVDLNKVPKGKYIIKIHNYANKRISTHQFFVN